MADIHKMNLSPPTDRRIDTGGGGGDNDRMERRVERLEGWVTDMRGDVAAIKATMATKADVEAVRSDIKGWMLATVLTIVAAVAAGTISLLSLNKPQTGAQPQPIVIQLPAIPQGSQAAPPGK